MSKYTHQHNSINGNTGCFVGFFSLLGIAIAFIVLICVFVFNGCNGRKNKVDETVAVDSLDVDSIWRIKGVTRYRLVVGGNDNAMAYMRGEDSSIIISGDTMALIKTMMIAMSTPSVVLVKNGDTVRHFCGWTDTIRIYPCTTNQLAEAKEDFIPLNQVRWMLCKENGNDTTYVRAERKTDPKN